MGAELRKTIKIYSGDLPDSEDVPFLRQSPFQVMQF
jgi:hypothetical protein